MVLLNVNAGSNSFPQLSCLQKMKLWCWLGGKGLYKGLGVNCSPSAWAGKYLMVLLIVPVIYSVYLLGVLVHTCNTVLMELSQFPVLTMLWFVLLSCQGAWK